MNNFLSNNLNHVVKGDCLELFKKLENNSIDVVFTSPPINRLNGIKRNGQTSIFTNFENI
jgi:DNA modification methylase